MSQAAPAQPSSHSILAPPAVAGVGGLSGGGQQQSDAQGFVDLNIPIRAINRSHEPVKWLYARVTYNLQPNVPAFLPYMAMVYWQGDPRAINLPTGRPTEQYRRNELERLRAVHGVWEMEEKWAQIPLVECYPIDSDTRFETVLHDPDGLSVSGESQTNNETQFLRTSMEDMAAQMRVMQAQLAAREQSDAATVAAGFDPNDLDSQVTTSKAISPEEATGQSMVGEAPVRKSPTHKTRARPGDPGSAVTKDGE